MTPAFTTLISAEALRDALAATPPPRVVDVGFDLADPAAGEVAWRASRIPGSLYLHLERDLSGPKNADDGRFRGRHPLPDRAAFAATLGRCGITPATQVVAVDRHGGMYAARLWWLLRWIGHDAAAVLDGGLAAWAAAGGALSTDTDALPVAAASAAPYPERPARVASIDADTLATRLGRVRLIDARAAERFRGEVEPLDAAAGHIPGASNRFFKDNLAADGRFKPAAALRAEFDALLGSAAPDATVHQCGSGVTACHNLFAMTHAGLPGALLYPGSWSEWSADPVRPIAQGA
jgi:thiosulfate/3-mercaptopyruvate sulfurtransferase